ncbi:MAG TPA: P-loop NTPase [Longimicrobiales bacterium]|nr:P-loop NTPase [Longimicrobiales bacterium]
MRRIRTYNELGPAGEEVPRQVEAQGRRLRERLVRVRRIVAVGSGKGGVGKSAVAANLAAALAERGERVGALDADVGGPSLARMLGVGPQPLQVTREGVLPAQGIRGTRVMSSDLLVQEGEALRWGAAATEHLWQSLLETGMLREFLSDVEWGALDWLVIDLPPGSDKIARLGALQLADLVLLVTTPSVASSHVVERSAAAARATGAAVGIVANMTHHVCRECGAHQPLFEADTVADLARDTGIPVLAGIPFDPRLATLTDAGTPIVLEPAPSPAADALRNLALRLLAAVPPRTTLASESSSAPAPAPES